MDHIKLSTLLKRSQNCVSENEVTRTKYKFFHEITLIASPFGYNTVVIKV